MSGRSQFGGTNENRADMAYRNLTVWQKLAVEGTAEIMTLNVYGPATFSGNTIVENNLTVTNTITTDNLVVNSNAFFEGPVVINNTLNVNELATFEDVLINGTLSVPGQSLLGNAIIDDALIDELDVATRLDVYAAQANFHNNVRIDDTLLVNNTVADNVLIEILLNVTGDTILSNTLVNDNLTIDASGGLNVQSEAFFNGHVIFNANVDFNANAIFHDQVYVENNLVLLPGANLNVVNGDTILNGTFSFTGTTFSVNASVGSTFQGLVDFQDGFEVTGGPVHFDSTGTWVLSNPTGAVIDSVGGLTVTNPIAPTILSGPVVAGSSLLVSGATTLSSTLDVSGASTLSDLTVQQDLIVQGTTALQTGATVTGAPLVANAGLNAPTATIGNLLVTADAIIQGDATVNQTLFAQDATVTDQLTVLPGGSLLTPSATVTSSLSLPPTATATFNGPVNLNQNTTFGAASFTSFLGTTDLFTRLGYRGSSNAIQNIPDDNWTDTTFAPVWNPSGWTLDGTNTILTAPVTAALFMMIASVSFDNSVPGANNGNRGVRIQSAFGGVNPNQVVAEMTQPWRRSGNAQHQIITCMEVLQNAAADITTFTVQAWQDSGVPGGLDLIGNSSYSVQFTIIPLLAPYGAI